MTEPDSDFFWISNGSRGEVYHLDRECFYLRHSTTTTMRASVARAWDTRDECGTCFPADETLVAHCDCGRPGTLGSRDEFVCDDCRTVTEVSLDD